MKIPKVLFILIVSFMGFSSMNEAKSQSVNVNFGLFQRELSPYGRWINTPNYGQVWSYNEPGFQPYYSNGNWDYTNEGWYWNSSYNWGWVTFHYGRWELDPYYGWVWIPGYDWAPAWVAWSQNPDYYGWAPMGYGINVNINIGSIPMNRWMFLPRRYITSRDFRNYGFSASRNPAVFRNVTIINAGRNDRYMRGPDRYEVERYTRTQIQPRRIEDYGRGGNINNGNDRNYNRGGDRRDMNFPQNRANVDNRNGMPQDRGIENQQPNIDANNNIRRNWRTDNSSNFPNSGGRVYGSGSSDNQTPVIQNRGVERSGGFGNRSNDGSQQNQGGFERQRGNNNPTLERRIESNPSGSQPQRNWGGERQIQQRDANATGSEPRTFNRVGRRG
jgi:hypothetical protein